MSLIGADGEGTERGYKISSATQLLVYPNSSAAGGKAGAYGAHTDCHDFRGNTRTHCWHLGSILPRVPAMIVRTGATAGDDRTLTILIYATTADADASESDPAPSGGTAFPALGLVVPAVAGRAVVFQDLSEHGDCHPYSAHESLPMRAGSSEKVVYQKWVHTGPYDRRQHGEGQPVGPGFAVTRTIIAEARAALVC